MSILQKHDNAMHEHGVYMMLNNPYIALVVKRPMDEYITSTQDRFSEMLAETASSHFGTSRYT